MVRTWFFSSWGHTDGRTSETAGGGGASRGRHATHHVEDGVDHQVDGHAGGGAPVLHRPHALLIAGAQELGQTDQGGVGEPSGAAGPLH